MAALGSAEPSGSAALLFAGYCHMGPFACCPSRGEGEMEGGRCGCRVGLHRVLPADGFAALRAGEATGSGHKQARFLARRACVGVG